MFVLLPLTKPVAFLDYTKYIVPRSAPNFITNTNSNVIILLHQNYLENDSTIHDLIKKYQKIITERCKYFNPSNITVNKIVIIIRISNKVID